MPRYVSTVDSGNLLASLWVLNQGCRELLQRPVVGHAVLRGLRDTLSIVRDTMPQRSFDRRADRRQLRQLLQGKLTGHHLISRLRLARRLAIEHLRNAGGGRIASDERSLTGFRGWPRELEAWHAAVRALPALDANPARSLRILFWTLGPGRSQASPPRASRCPSLLDLADDGASGSTRSMLFSRRRSC